LSSKPHQTTSQHIKSTPKPSQKPQNGLGLLSKTHTLPPLRQAISLSALALLVFELAPSPPKQKLNRTKRLALAT